MQRSKIFWAVHGPNADVHQVGWKHSEERLGPMPNLSPHKGSLAAHGFCVVPDVLTREESAKIRTHLIEASEESVRRGVPTHIDSLDPNAANVRVFNLIDLDVVFRELILHPTAAEMVTALLGEGWMISNFTANIAKPGSKSMAIHSDQGIVMPEPWLAPCSINIIWCLDDVDEENGATRYLPESHKITSLAELPTDIGAHMKPFEAAAGSIIAMDGRVWHTSGENVSRDRERALLFGYYSRDFIRPQVNWNAALSPDTLASIKSPLFDRLGLGPTANISVNVNAGVMTKT